MAMNISLANSGYNSGNQYQLWIPSYYNGDKLDFRPHHSARLGEYAAGEPMKYREALEVWGNMGKRSNHVQRLNYRYTLPLYSYVDTEFELLSTTPFMAHLSIVRPVVMPTWASERARYMTMDLAQEAQLANMVDGIFPL